jgi:drug/metabolite transporter (DMT)-like permease
VVVTLLGAGAEPGGRPRLPVAGLLNLGVLYIVWGSTYLAIRVAVREGSGWGPFWMGGSRVLVAAAILFLVNRLRGVRMRPTRDEFVLLIATGVLLWIGGNGAVVWAEQRIDSGLAALIVGTMPIWVAGMEAVIDRRPPSLLLLVSLAVGFSGLAVLSYPTLRGGVTADLLGVIAVVFAAVSWGSASILMYRRQINLDAFVIAGWQHLIGAIGFAVITVLVGEAKPNPTPEAWAAWMYLVVLGTLAFCSFVYAVKVLPTTIVMTYAYVNPVIAVVLGWMILSEPITPYTIIGTVLIVSGVRGVFREKAKR